MTEDPAEAADAADDSKAVEERRAADVSPLDPSELPVAHVPAATPPAPARVLAFSSILIGGLCGGLIGFAFTDLQCTDGCAGWAGIGALIGAAVGAVGVAVVAVLVLRAMDEWNTTQKRTTPKENS